MVAPVGASTSSQPSRGPVGDCCCLKCEMVADCWPQGLVQIARRAVPSKPTGPRHEARSPPDPVRVLGGAETSVERGVPGATVAPTCGRDGPGIAAAPLSPAETWTLQGSAPVGANPVSLVRPGPAVGRWCCSCDMVAICWSQGLVLIARRAVPSRPHEPRPEARSSPDSVRIHGGTETSVERGVPGVTKAPTCGREGPR